MSAVTASSDAATLLYTASIGVRWRDLDAFNHVNNSSYLTFLEEARLQWLQQLKGTWLSEKVSPVMAASQLNYRRPIEWPARLRVELYSARMGNSSMTNRAPDRRCRQTRYAVLRRRNRDGVDRSNYRQIRGAACGSS